MSARLGISRRRLAARAIVSASVLGALALAPACGSEVDGHAPEAVSGTACSRDRDCGIGRHCSDGVCAIDCVTSDECAPSSSGEARECSACGRCVPHGQVDGLCAPERDVPCTSSKECQEGLGADYVCDDRKVCARTCASDDACAEIGRGFTCMSGVCRRACIDDDQCALFGWGFSCELPAGVDPATNHDAQTPVSGECVAREGGIDWGPDGPVSAPGTSWRGIWGVLLNTAAKVTDVPVVGEQNTMSTAYLLVKMTEASGTVTWDEKWCSITFRNFKDDDSDPHSLFTPVASDRYVDAIRIQQNHIPNAPAFAAGVSTPTDTMLEVRGAKLPDPANSPLPTMKDLTYELDQDHDGKPGMTLDMTGIATGQIDHVQRWTVTYAVSVADGDHLQGFVQSKTEQKILDASDPALLYDTVSDPHPDPTRSYFRAVRLPDDASCEDVETLANEPGGWLAFVPHFDAGATPH